MANDINHLLDGLKTVIQNGFVQSGRQYFGTSGAGIFQVKDFDGSTKPFIVQNYRQAIGSNINLTPYIYLHPVVPTMYPHVGGFWNQYDVQLMVVFTQTHSAIVESSSLKEEPLARYFLKEIIDGFLHLSGGNAGQAVGLKIDILPEHSQTGLIDSNIYGAAARFRISFR